MPHDNTGALMTVQTHRQRERQVAYTSRYRETGKDRYVRNSQRETAWRTGTQTARETDKNRK